MEVIILLATNQLPFASSDRWARTATGIANVGQESEESITFLQTKSQ